MAGSMPLAFGALLAGAVILDYGVKNARQAFGSGSAAAASATAGSSGNTKAIGSFPEAVDPLPGAIGSRLDQGIDATGHTFLSPWDGKVVASTQAAKGWGGGGYIAVQSSSDPNMVWYTAEGIAPTLKVGDMVKAGETLGYPVLNPYNMVLGNVEAGRANPAAPMQPLAQVVSDPAGMVHDVYDWLLKLGGPKATSTSSAGHG